MRTIRHTLAICVSVLSLIGIAHRSDALIPGSIQITTCNYDINIPNRVYEVANDLTCINAHGMYITVDKVTIDIAGHVIRGNSADGYFGIGLPGQNGFSKVTVRNGTILGFDFGLDLTNAGLGDITVSDVAVIGNEFGGDIIAEHATVDRLVANQNGGDGFRMLSQHTTLRNSQAVLNGRDGFSFQYGKTINASNNIAISNGQDGALVADKEGTGFKVQQGGLVAYNGVKFTRNVSSANATSGFDIEGSGVTLKNNTADGNGVAIGNALGRAVFVHGGIDAPKGKNLTRRNENPCLPENVCKDFKPATKGTVVDHCNFDANQPGLYRLTGNLACLTTEPVFVVNADKVTLDLGGFRLDSGGVGVGVAPNTNASTFEIRNGVVEEQDFAGISFVPQSGGGTFTMNNVLLMRNDGAGVIANAKKVVMNKVASIRNDGDGIAAGNGLPTDDSDHVTIKNSHSFENENRGVNISNTDGTSLSKVISAGNDDEGINITGNRSKVKGSVISSNLKQGFYVDEDAADTAGRTTVDGNLATGNGFGPPDGSGNGIWVDGFANAPKGKNISFGNDNNGEPCTPVELC